MLFRLPDILSPLMPRGLWHFALILAALVMAGLAGWGVWSLVRRWPTTAEALARLDRDLPDRPISALRDRQALGTDDPATTALWQAHQDRMLHASAKARAPLPDPALARRDPFGLRLMALLALAVALLFGPPAPRPEAANPLGAAHAPTASWEGWISPPAYSGLPNLYLSDQPQGVLPLLKDSRITLRFYGEGIGLEDSVSEGTQAADPAAGPDIRQITVTRAGEISLTGAAQAAWEITLIPDAAPTIALDGAMEVAAQGGMTQDFRAQDDVAVTELRAVITLDPAQVARRHGLAIAPMDRAPLEIALPLPFAGSRSDFTGTLSEDFSTHPFANLPVSMVLVARDGAGQDGRSDPVAFRLPGRRFFQPVAKAVIEQRRDILWNHANAPRALDLLRAVAHRPQDLRLPPETLAQLRAAIADLAPLAARPAAITPDEEAAIAQTLWDLALQLEEGDLADARARLARAQERLNEAMRNGASPEEIADLMDELRAATDAYLDLLAQSAEAPETDIDAPDRGESDEREVTQDQIQALMDEIQRLMQEGRMEEAQQLMLQLDELLRNLQMQQADGQGNGPPRPGQESIEELQDTLREQQELADEAFRDLQDQFNNRNPQDGQPDQPQPGQGAPQNGPQGQQDGPQNGQPQGGTGPQGQEEGNAPSGQTGPDADGEGATAEGQDGGADAGATERPEPQGGAAEGSMADRQQGLRREIERQRAQLPGLTGEAAERARDALEAAEGAMDRAEDALRNDDLATAIDNQAQALNALREGLRALDEAFAANDPEAEEALQNGEGDSRAPARNDPLGRQDGQSGQTGRAENMLDGLDPEARASELLEELRRRAGERGREESELDYLRRLLDQF